MHACEPVPERKRRNECVRACVRENNVGRRVRRYPLKGNKEREKEKREEKEEKKEKEKEKGKWSIWFRTSILFYRAS